MIEPLVSILAPAGTPGERLRADAVGACAADLSTAVTASNDDPGGSGLNAPELGTAFLREQMSEIAPELHFTQRIPNPPVFADVDEERSLKVLVYRAPGLPGASSEATVAPAAPAAVVGAVGAAGTAA